MQNFKTTPLATSLRRMFYTYHHAMKHHHTNTILSLFITPVYEVYRGYIVFVFSITVFVCVLCKLLFIKDFSGTTEPRILKFRTNVGYNLLYCVKDIQPSDTYHFLYKICPFFFLPIKLFVTEFSAPITARVFKFCTHLERGQIHCGKENQGFCD